MPSLGVSLGTFRVNELGSAGFGAVTNGLYGTKNVTLVGKTGCVRWRKPCARKAQCASGDPHSEKAETRVGPLESKRHSKQMLASLAKTTISRARSVSSALDV